MIAEAIFLFLTLNFAVFCWRLLDLMRERNKLERDKVEALNALCEGWNLSERVAPQAGIASDKPT